MLVQKLDKNSHKTPKNPQRFHSIRTIRLGNHPKPSAIDLSATDFIAGTSECGLAER
jgi:hypothetical protein